MRSDLKFLLWFSRLLLIIMISMTIYTVNMIFNIKVDGVDLEIWRKIALCIVICSPYLLFITNVGKRALKSLF